MNEEIAAAQAKIDECLNYYPDEVALQTTNEQGDYYVSTNASWSMWSSAFHAPILFPERVLEGIK